MGGACLLRGPQKLKIGGGGGGSKGYTTELPGFREDDRLRHPRLQGLL